MDGEVYDEIDNSARGFHMYNDGEVENRCKVEENDLKSIPWPNLKLLE